MVIMVIISYPLYFDPYWLLSLEEWRFYKIRLRWINEEVSFINIITVCLINSILYDSIMLNIIKFIPANERVRLVRSDHLIGTRYFSKLKQNGIGFSDGSRCTTYVRSGTLFLCTFVSPSLLLNSCILASTWVMKTSERLYCCCFLTSDYLYESVLSHTYVRDQKSVNGFLFFSYLQFPFSSEDVYELYTGHFSFFFQRWYYFEYKRWYISVYHIFILCFIYYSFNEKCIRPDPIITILLCSISPVVSFF